MRILRVIGWVVLSGWAVSLVHAQTIRVLASVSETTIGTQETVAYTIQAQGVGSLSPPEAPEAEGLALAQSFPNSQTSMSIVNGAISRSVSFTFVYRPVREGRATIAPATLTIDGREYRTDAITVEVVPQAQRPARRQAPTRRNPFGAFGRSNPQPAPEPAVPGERDLFIEVVPSTRSAVPHQQVTVNYLLYFREGIQLRQSRLTDSWDAEGFWREELEVEARPIPQIVVKDGLRYNRITLKRSAVFPTRSGELSIDPLKIESEAILPNRSADPFARFFSLQSRFSPIEISSIPLKFSIAPLPPQAPSSFQGGVGSLRFSADYDRTELEVGESLQLTIRISGDGNIATLGPPVFESPGAFERYDPQVTSSIDRSGSRLRGTKTLVYVLVPRSNGTFEMPALEYSWYDPAGGEYVTRTVDPVTVNVTGTGTPAATILALSGGLPVDDIAGPIAAKPRWVRLHAPALHRKLWPYLAILLPGLLLGLFHLAGRHSRHLAANPSIARLRRAGPLARKHLKEADRRLSENDPVQYYEALERALLGFVGNRLNVAEQGLTRDSLDRVLETASIPGPVRNELIVFLDECDQARFSPILPPLEAMRTDRERAADLLVTLDDALTA
jgi:oxygen tolerance protein BatD